MKATRRQRWALGLAGALLLTAAAGSARAQSPDPTALSGLTLTEVLAAAERLVPTLEAARQDLAAAQGLELEGEGAFDPTWRSRASWVPLGYYKTGRLETVLQQPTDLYGLSAFAGWRLGAGSFAVYDGKAATADFGELRAGLALPLLRDRSIDKRRADRAVAQLEPAVAQAGLAQARLELRRAAAVRYWGWVEAGQQQLVAQELLQKALARDAGLAERVRRGDLAETERLDHRRAVLARQGQVVAAQQRSRSAALELSLYLRDAAGQPAVPGQERMPAAVPPLPEIVPELSVHQQTALQRRPELQRMAVWHDQQQAQAQQAVNARLPALDVQAAVSRDLGQGPASLGPVELEVAVMLDVPLLGRVPDAKIQQARAKLAKLQAQQQWARERVAVEVGQVHAELQAARERAGLAEQELAQARKLAEAERISFAGGASTVLVLNLREQAEGEAELREVTARIDWHRAWASWLAVTAAP